MLGLKAKAIGFLVGALVLAGLYFYAYTKGENAAAIRCEQEKLIAISKEKQNYEKIKNKNMRLSDPDLDSRLAKWLRE